MNTTIDRTRVYTTDEVAEILQVEKRTVLKLVKRGMLTANKIGFGYKYSGESILELLNSDKDKEE